MIEENLDFINKWIVTVLRNGRYKLIVQYKNLFYKFLTTIIMLLGDRKISQNIICPSNLHTG